MTATPATLNRRPFRVTRSRGGCRARRRRCARPPPAERRPSCPRSAAAGRPGRRRRSRPSARTASAWPCAQHGGVDRKRPAVAGDPGAWASGARSARPAGITGRPAARGKRGGQDVRAGRRRPGALVGLSWSPRSGRARGQRGRSRRDRRPAAGPPRPAAPQVPGGKPADEQEPCPWRQPSSPASAPRLPAGAAGQPRLVDERAVAHRDQPVGGGRDPLVVGDDDQGLPGRMQAVEQPEHLEGRGAVEVAGGLVGEDDERLVGQRAGDRDPLALPAGQRRGQVTGPVGKPDPLQQFRARRRAARGERPASSAGSSTFSQRSARPSGGRPGRRSRPRRGAAGPGPSHPSGRCGARPAAVRRRRAGPGRPAGAAASTSRSRSAPSPPPSRPAATSRSTPSTARTSPSPCRTPCAARGRAAQCVRLCRS